MRDNPAMGESWFHRIEDDVRHVTAHLHRHGPTVEPATAQPQPQEPSVALADTANDLGTTTASLRVSLEGSATALRDALDNHLARVDSLVADVAAVASIADSPIVAAAAGALHVPPEILDGFARSLSAIAAAWPKPQDAQAVPEAPAEPAGPEAAAEPQPDEGEQAA